MKRILIFLFLLTACESEPVEMELQNPPIEQQLDYYSPVSGFGLNYGVDYKVQPFFGQEGFLMKKWVELNKEEASFYEIGGYKVEITALAYDNLTDAERLVDFVALKYPGYDIDFVDYDHVSGVYVNEGLKDEALRHFFAMSRDAKKIYEVSMKLDSHFYGRHVEEFANIVSTLMIGV